VRILTLVAVTALMLLGCPPTAGEQKKAPAANAPCTKVGDSCEFSPGKLGTCVSQDDCATPPCFTCQSQH